MAAEHHTLFIQDCSQFELLSDRPSRMDRKRQDSPGKAVAQDSHRSLGRLLMGSLANYWPVGPKCVTAYGPAQVGWQIPSSQMPRAGDKLNGPVAETPFLGLKGVKDG